MTSLRVTALVLVPEGADERTLEATLAALDRQTRSADRVVIERGAHTDALAAARAVDLSDLRTESTEDAEDWLWLLPAGCDPAPDALAAQVEAVLGDPGLAVIGAKHLAEPAGTDLAGAPAHLADVGVSLTPDARIITGIETGAIDQGQDDARGEVLAVGLEAMLVRTAVLEAAGGFDAALASPWAEIALCHRIWRRGGRVQVVPQARALRAQEHAVGRERRAGQILAALALLPWPLAILRLILEVPIALLRILAALVTHRPRRMLDEAAGWAIATVRAPGVILRAAGGSRVPRRRLRGLLVSRPRALALRLEEAWAALFADDDATRAARRMSWGIAGTTHGTRDADYGRHGVWALVVALTSIILTLWCLRSLLGGEALTGPGLVPLPADGSQTAQAAWSDWIPSGLGTSGWADPLVRLLGSLPIGLGGGAETVRIIVLAAIPVSALGMWWAAGALTRAVGARLVLTAAWALSPPLIGALDQGSWPFLLVHMLLPLLALAIGRAIGLVRKRSLASVSAAAAGGLVLLVLGAVQPLLVLLAAAALVLIAVMAPGRRLRLLWVLVPSLALHAPSLGDWIREPRALLGAGASPGSGTASAPDLLRVLTLWPADAPRWPLLEDAFGAQASQLVPLLLLVPVALTALAGPWLTGQAGRVARLGVTLAGGSLLLAVGLAPLAVGVIGASMAHVAVGGLQSAALLGLLLAAGCTLDALARRDELVGRSRRALTTIAAALFVLTTAAAVIGWTVELPASLALRAGDGDQLPVAAADQALSASRSRTLLLAPGAEDPSETTARLIVGGADTAVQTSAVVSARQVRAAEQDALDTDPADAALLRTGAGLLGGTGEASAGLQAMAVGFVVVPPAASETEQQDQAALVETLDRSELLERVASTEDGTLWRVIDARARAAVLADSEGGSEDGSVALASQVIDASGTLAPASAQRTIVLSERAAGAWHAEVDGTALRPVTVDGWAQGFVLPAGTGGTVTIDHGDPARRTAFQLLLAVACALTALVAIPWRSRASVAERTRENAAIAARGLGGSGSHAVAEEER